MYMQQQGQHSYKAIPVQNSFWEKRENILNFLQCAGSFNKWNYTGASFRFVQTLYLSPPISQNTVTPCTMHACLFVFYTFGVHGNKQVPFALPVPFVEYRVKYTLDKKAHEKSCNKHLIIAA